jgi:integrase
MASIRRRGASFRAEIYKDGNRESATFPTRREAAAWALQREAELGGERLPDHTVGDALQRFVREVTPARRGARWERVRAQSLGRDPLAGTLLRNLGATQLAEWRDRRLGEVGPATVRRDLTFLSAIFRKCVREWRWLRSNPVPEIDKPPAPPPRRRRISADEIERVVLALGYDGGEPANASQRTALAFLFALETAMRAGEILGLTWENVSPRSVLLPRTKNGDQRKVPLSSRAREILDLLPRGAPTCFDVDPAVRDALFRKARDRAGVQNLHFHDSRAEAIYRLSKKLDILELARVIGHRDVRSLMFYYEADADELALKLG